MQSPGLIALVWDNEAALLRTWVYTKLCLYSIDWDKEAALLRTWVYTRLCLYSIEDIGLHEAMCVQY